MNESKRLGTPGAEPAPVLTIAEFCAQHRIGRATLHHLDKAGRGPRCLRIGRRRYVTAEAAAEWRRRMEDETAAAPQPRASHAANDANAPA
jgi:hypothetical protein